MTEIFKFENQEVRFMGTVDYKPTQKPIDGNDSQLEMSTYKDGDGKNTKYQLRWWSAIIDVLVNNWGEQ